MKKRIFISLLLVAALVVGTAPALASDTVVSRSMVVEGVSGDNVSMTRGTNLAFPVREGARLNTGNTVTTGRASTVDIRMDDDSSIRMNASTKVDISRASRRALNLTVINGSIAVNTGTQVQGGTTTIRAGNSTMGLRGTLFAVSYLGGEMRTVLLEGALDIATPDGTFELAAGQVLEHSVHAITGVQALDIAQLPDSFTLELIREHAEMLISIGTITAADAQILDSLIAERQAEEAARADAAAQGRPDASRSARNLLGTPTAPPAGGGGDTGRRPTAAFAVTYNLNGGHGAVPTQANMVAGATFAAATANGLTPPSGYALFIEWNTQADGSGRSYAPGAIITMPSRALTLHAIWGNEDGRTKETAFRIKTAEDLNKIGTGNWTLSSYYRLMNDITAPTNFMIAGAFHGNFDGMGHTIKVDINTSIGGAGLFQRVCSGTVQNLTVAGVVRGQDEVGGLVGRVCSSGKVINSHSTAQVIGRNYVGGLVGVNHGTIKNSSASGIVVGTNDYGDLYGANYGTVQN